MAMHKMGYTTGTCATAAAFAAACRLLGKAPMQVVPIRLPNHTLLDIPIFSSQCNENFSQACVIKESGDDPDITHKAEIHVMVQKSTTQGVSFVAGIGVGTVTKPGLQIPPGEPAINPVPRKMITEHLLALGSGWTVTISVPNGLELAQKTFNPRLGIVGGISILGTSGQVRPFNHESQLCSIRCALSVANEALVHNYVFVAGHYGEKTVLNNYTIHNEQSLIEVGNDWGFALESLCPYKPNSLLVVGHAGKLAKLAAKHWDTHSSRSPSIIEWVVDLWNQENHLNNQLQTSEFTTVESFYLSTKESPYSPEFWKKVCDLIKESISEKMNHQCSVAVTLCDMKSQIIAESTGALKWK